MHKIRQNGRDISLPLLPYLKAQAEMLGYIAAILVLFALLFSLSKQGRLFRVFGWVALALGAGLAFPELFRPDTSRVAGDRARKVPAAVVLLRGCWHTHMSWPTRYDDHYSYRVCTDCGIKRLFDPESFRSYGPYIYDLRELIARDRARRMRQQKITA